MEYINSEHEIAPPREKASKSVLHSFTPWLLYPGITSEPNLHISAAVIETASSPVTSTRFSAPRIFHLLPFHAIIAPGSPQLFTRAIIMQALARTVYPVFIEASPRSTHSHTRYLTCRAVCFDERWFVSSILTTERCLLQVWACSNLVLVRTCPSGENKYIVDEADREIVDLIKRFPTTFGAVCWIGIEDLPIIYYLWVMVCIRISRRKYPFDVDPFDGMMRIVFLEWSFSNFQIETEISKVGSENNQDNSSKTRILSAL